MTNIEKVYQQNVLDIFKKKLGVKEDKQAAEIIGLSSEEFANRKRRGTLIQTLFSEALKRELNLNEIFYPNLKQGLKNELLKEIETWLVQLIAKENGRELWFEYQFNDSFPTFRAWKEEKERSAVPEASYPVSKVA